MAVSVTCSLILVSVLQFVLPLQDNCKALLNNKEKSCRVFIGGLCTGQLTNVFERENVLQGQCSGESFCTEKQE